MPSSSTSPSGPRWLSSSITPAPLEDRSTCWSTYEGTAEIGPFAQQTTGAIERQVQVNLNAVLALTRQALPGMLKEREHGHLVFMSSLQAAAPTPAFATYGATKAAISHFASILRLELAQTPIGITVVAPGPVDTPLWDSVEASPYTATLLRRSTPAPVCSPRTTQRCSPTRWSGRFRAMPW